jgi:hypothetical protein
MVVVDGVGHLSQGVHEVLVTSVDDGADRARVDAVARAPRVSGVVRVAWLALFIVAAVNEKVARAAPSQQLP